MNPHTLQPLRLAVTLALSLGFAGTGAAQTFRTDFDLGQALGRDLAMDSDGSCAVVANKSGLTTLGRLDAAGQVTSVRELATVSGHSLNVSCATFTSTGTLVLGGAVVFNAWLAGVDPDTGATQWDHSVGDFDSVIRAVSPTADGGVVAAGFNEALTLGQRGIVVRVDAQGQLLWKRDFAAAEPTPYIDDVLGTSDGGALLSANRSPQGPAPGPWGTLLTRLDAAGEILWQRFYGGDNALRYAKLTETLDGGFVLFGLAEIGSGTEDFRFWSMRVDPLGNPVWSHLYETYPTNYAFGSLHDVAGLVATPDGGFGALVQQPLPLWAGTANNTPALFKLDSNGDVTWYRNLGVETLETSEKPLALHSTPGGFLIGGQRDGEGVRVVRTQHDGRVGGDCAPEHDFLYTQQPLAVDSVAGYAPMSTNFGNPLQQHTFALFKTGNAYSLCGNDCHIQGGSFGIGLPGAGGIIPQLTAKSGYCLGGDASLEITSSLGGTLGILFYSGVTGTLPFLGGTSYVNPSTSAMIVFLTDGTPGAPGAGSTSLPVQGDYSGLVGSTVYCQAMLHDPAAVQSWSMTPAALLNFE